MSWWFGVEIDTGGSEPVEITDRNMTYNLSPMLREALGVPFGDLHGAPCSEAGGVLRRAIERMEVDPERFKAHDAPNGWGTYGNCLDALSWLLHCCEQHPRARIFIH